MIRIFCSFFGFWIVLLPPAAALQELSIAIQQKQRRSTSYSPTITTTTTSPTVDDSPFRQSYLDRLKLAPSQVDDKKLGVGATADKLELLQESHLEHVCFENLGHHGAVGGLPRIDDLHHLENKILNLKRGGFCFEVNALFARLLELEGYQVYRFPAYPAVDNNPEDGSGIYRDQPKHLLLHVIDCTNQSWIVDVAFGEPSIHPLRYEMNSIQITPEGMHSRMIVKPQQQEDADNDEMVYLQWLQQGQWQDRMKWNAKLVNQNRPIHKFQPNLDLCLLPESIFSKKIICCRLTRTTKTTVSGTKLKITSPRTFCGGLNTTAKEEANNDENENIQETELKSVEEVRSVLEDLFGIPRSQTEGLDLSKSILDQDGAP